MGIAGGPNLNQDGLVFLYDVFDQDNSYKGEPATNSQNADISSMTQVGFDNWSCYDGSPPYHTWGTNQSKTFVTIPGPFGASVNAMLYHNFNGGFYGPTDWGGVPNGTITAGRTYTVQGWVKAADSNSIGKTVKPYTYYSHSGGAYSAGTNYTLTDQWQLVSHTHTVQYNATSGGNMYFFTENSGAVKMYLTMTGVFLDESHAVQWLLGGTTRSATQGLLDVAGTTQIDLSNVSFDANAQMYFDGTNDYVDISSAANLEIVDNVTVEAILKVNTSNLGAVKVIANKYSGTGWEFVLGSAGNFAFGGRNGDGTYYSSDSSTIIADNQYHHIVGIKTGLYWKTYVDGILKSTLTAGSIGTLYNTTAMQLGREGSYYYTAMYLNGFKVYNRALTNEEVLQNYNATKSRFGLK